MMWFAVTILGLLVLWVLFDVVQRKHAIMHNFPIIGHFRYWLEVIGPELRQYIVTSNNEERPFNRDQRRWIYASSKKENSNFGFGTDNDLELSSNYVIIKPSVFPLSHTGLKSTNLDPAYPLPCAKILGGPRNRRKAFRPASVVNVSGMSFGALGSRAVEALNRGVALADCFQNTGEGGISPYHRNGGDLVMQIGTAYFGCRDEHGNFSLPRLVELLERTPSVKAIEVKLSQGAKPALGGLLPAQKITPEIAAIRGIPRGKDCKSPSSHTAFRDADSLLDFVELIADETGLPVGVKSAIGELGFWTDLSRLMAKGDRGADFITVDGGEGGTGASPLVFTDHVALPFKIAFSRVHRAFVEQGVHEKIVFQGSGKLGLPENALLAFALGCDLIAVGREAMLSIGCIQAQRCHTNHCPVGIATHNRWLMQGLDPTLKSVRLANYIVTLRMELSRLSWACGVPHPAFVSSDSVEILDGRFGGTTAAEVFGCTPGTDLPSRADLDALTAILKSDDVHEASKN